MASASNSRFYGIQILRGIAAVLVLFHHQLVAIRDLSIPGGSQFAILSRGAFGVDIFFPVSGFVMFLTASSALRRPDAACAAEDFARRRLIRIAPLYWFFTTLRLLVVRLTTHGRLLAHLSLWYIAASYLFLPCYNPQGKPLPVLPAGWTLSYEMLFYAVVTFCILRRKPLIGWCALIIGALSLISLIIPRTWGGLTWLASPIELEFLGGLLLAQLCLRRVLLRPVAAVIAIVAAALWVALAPWEAEESVLRALLWGVPGCLLVWAFTSIEAVVDLSRRKFLLLLGDASYSLYLLHLFIVPFTARALAQLRLQGTLALAAAQVVGAAMTVALSIVVHIRVETPLMSLLSRIRWRQLSPHTDPVSEPMSVNTA